jgi:hypothetical protein
MGVDAGMDAGSWKDQWLFIRSFVVDVVGEDGEEVV